MEIVKRLTAAVEEADLKNRHYFSQQVMPNAFNINHSFRIGLDIIPYEINQNDMASTKKTMLLTNSDVAANHVSENMRFRKNPIISEMMVIKFPVTKKRSGSTTCLSQIVTKNPITTSEDLEVFSQDLIDQLLVYLKDQLRNEKLFKMKEATKDTVPGALLEDEILDITAEVISSKDCLYQNIISLCTSTKEMSLAFQNYLSECTEEETRIIGLKISNHYRQLITHRYANYVLQRLVVKDPYTLKALSSYCQANFMELIHNEYASRVLQALIETSLGFRHFVIKIFKSDLTLCLGKITAVYLLIACIKNTADLREMHFLVESLQYNQGLISCKLYQRVLVTYVQHCTEEDLEEVYRVMKIKKNIRSFLNNKFLTYVILTMLQRGQQRVISSLIDLIVYKTETLFETRFFKLLLSKLWDQNSGVALAQIASTLANLHPEKVKELMSKEFYFYFYIFITISSFGSSQTKEMTAFLSRSDLIWQISQLIIRMKADTKEAQPVSLRFVPN